MILYAKIRGRNKLIGQTKLWTSQTTPHTSSSGAIYSAPVVPIYENNIHHKVLVFNSMEIQVKLSSGVELNMIYKHTYLWSYFKMVVSKRLNLILVLRALTKIITFQQTICIIHCGIMTPYGVKQPGQHWFRQWLVLLYIICYSDATSDITHTKYQILNINRPSCSCLGLMRWSQVLSREWHEVLVLSSTDSRCSNYIWVINNFIAY